MYVSRSAVSLQMKSLEDEFRAKLFDRSKRPPTLNQTGVALVPKIRDLIEAYDFLLQSATSENTISGNLTIGAISTAMSGLIPGAIKQIRDIYPNLHVLVSPDHSPYLLAEMEHGRLDAAVISEPPYLGPHMEFRPLAEEPLVLLAPLECEMEDPLDILRTYPFIRFTRSLWAGHLIDSWLRKENIQVRELMELANKEMISTMVLHGLGVSIIPDSCVPSPVPLPLRRISLGSNAPSRILGFLVCRDNLKSQLTNVFFDQMVHLIKCQKRSNA